MKASRAAFLTVASLLLALVPVVAPTVTVGATPVADPVRPTTQETRLAPAALRTTVGPPTGTPDGDGGGVTLSARSPATGFAVVGITWDASADGVTEVGLRTRDGDRWSAWTDLHAEESLAPGEGPDANRAGTAPVIAGEVEEVEVRIELGEGTDPDARLVVVDPGTSDVDALQPAPAATASAAAPSVLPRSAWGADESMMTWTPEQGTVRGTVIHHTAGTNDYGPDQVPAIVRGIYAYHVDGRGWGDIGYNFLVDRFGRAWEGRNGGMSLQTIGAHASGWNSSTTGISVMGDFTAAGVPAATWSALVQLVAWKLAIHGVRPYDTFDLGGVQRPAIVGHRDAAQTACPGQQLYDRLNELRGAVASAQGQFADVFGSALGNFVKTADDPTVYLVSGRTRHPVTDWSTLMAFQHLGGISLGSPAYVGSLTVGGRLGRFVRDGTSGDVFFVDASIRLRAPSCEMVADYGSACDAAVRLTGSQLGRLTRGPQLERGFVTTNGKLFYVVGGQRREAFDGAAVAGAGFDTGYVRLTEAAISRLPYGDPILRADVVLRGRADGSTYFYTGGRKQPTNADVVSATVLSRLPSASFDAPSLERTATGSGLRGFVRPPEGTGRFLLTDAGLLALDAASRPAESAFTVWDSSLFTGLPHVPTSQPIFLRTVANPAVVWADAGELRPVTALQDLRDLGGSSEPTVRRTSDTSWALLPVGRPVPSPGSLVKGSGSPTVYLVDGYDRSIPVETFAVTDALGVRGVTTVPDATLQDLPSTTRALSPFIDCNGAPMVGAGGSVYPHSRASTTGVPVSVLTAQACGRLPIVWSTISGPVFVKSTHDATVWHVSGGRRQAVRSWTELVALAGTTDPRIHVLGPMMLAQIPQG